VESEVLLASPYADLAQIYAGPLTLPLSTSALATREVWKLRVTLTCADARGPARACIVERVSSLKAIGTLTDCIRY
jgi:hypothetical protein